MIVKCESCGKLAETTMNNNGDIIHLCKECYNKIKFGVK